MKKFLLSSVCGASLLLAATDKVNAQAYQIPSVIYSTPGNWTGPQNFTGGGNVTTKAISGASRSSILTDIPFLWGRNVEQGSSSTSTSTGGTGLLGFVAPYSMHDVVVRYGLFQEASGGGEIPLANPVTWTTTLEYPIGTFTPITYNGKQSVTANGGFVVSDHVGITIPSGAAAFVRTYVQVCLAPTIGTVSAGTGGSMASGTYYVKVTQVCGPQGESGPTAEGSATVSSSGTLTVNWTSPLAWAPPTAPNTSAAASVPPTAYNIYLSTSTGTEVYLTTVYNPGATSYTYSGGITAGTATPPANQVWPQGPYALLTRSLGENEGANYASQSGNGSNQTLTSGVSWESSNNIYTWGPIDLAGIPDQGKDVPVACIYGDSIANGVNDSIGQRGYIARQLIANNIPYYFAPKPGEYITNLFTSTAQGSARIQYSSACSVAIMEYGTNDIYVSVASLATVQANALTDWTLISSRGAKVYQTTILPRTATTDSQATTTNQYPGGDNSVTAATNATPIVISSNQPVTAFQGAPVYINNVGGNTAANGDHYACNVSTPTFQLFNDSACTSPVVGSGAYTSGGTHSKFWVEGTRIAYNTWLRCGAPIVNGVATTCNNPNAIVAGQSGHPLSGYIEVNSKVEVNNSNVLTLNGGRWISDGTGSDCTNDGTHPYSTSPLNCQLNPSQAIPLSLFTAP